MEMLFLTENDYENLDNKKTEFIPEGASDDTSAWIDFNLSTDK